MSARTFSGIMIVAEGTGMGTFGANYIGALFMVKLHQAEHCSKLTGIYVIVPAWQIGVSARVN